MLRLFVVAAAVLVLTVFVGTVASYSECDPNNGGCSGTCTNGNCVCVGDNNCCKSGYTQSSGAGLTTCDDINECATTNGGCGTASCINTDGSYTCAAETTSTSRSTTPTSTSSRTTSTSQTTSTTRTTGTTTKPTTTTTAAATTTTSTSTAAAGTAPCTAASCPTNAQCVNGACACNVGYRMDSSTCKDINECSTNSDNNCLASSLATCTNTVGSFTCKCNSGLTGDGITSCYHSRKVYAGGHTSGCGLGATCTITPSSDPTINFRNASCIPMSTPVVGGVQALTCAAASSTIATSVTYAGDSDTFASVFYESSGSAQVFATGPVVAASYSARQATDYVTGSTFSHSVVSISQSSGSLSKTGDDLTPAGCVKDVLVYDESSNDALVYVCGCFTKSTSNEEMNGVAHLVNGAWKAVTAAPSPINPTMLAYDYVNQLLAVANRTDNVHIYNRGGGSWNSSEVLQPLQGSILAIDYAPLLAQFVFVGSNLCFAGIPSCGAGPFMWAPTTGAVSTMGEVWTGSGSAVDASLEAVIVGGSFLRQDGGMHSIAIMDGPGDTWEIVQQDPTFVVSQVKICEV